MSLQHCINKILACQYQYYSSLYQTNFFLHWCLLSLMSKHLMLLLEVKRFYGSVNLKMVKFGKKHYVIELIKKITSKVNCFSQMLYPKLNLFSIKIMIYDINCKETFYNCDDFTETVAL